MASRHRPTVGALGITALGAALFFATSHASSVFLSAANMGVALCWLPNAVVVVALTMSRTSYWPAIILGGWLGELAADHLYGIPLQHSLLLGLVNMTEATIVALLVRRFTGPRPYVRTARGVAAFAAAAISVPLFTGVAGAAVAVPAFDSAFGIAWRTWWLGDALGILVGAPVGWAIVGVLSDPTRQLSRAKALAAIASSVLLVGSVMWSRMGHSASVQFVAIAVAVFLALALGSLGAALGSLGVAVTAVSQLSVAEHASEFTLGQALLIPVIVSLLSVGAVIETLEERTAELEEANARVRLMADTDELTGLANLRAFRQTAGRELARCRRANETRNLIFVDLDGLKVINDRWGHEAGSAALIALADVLRATFRRADMIARVGGDEFVVLLDRDEDDPTAAVARLRQALRERNAGAARPLHASIGVATSHPQDHLDDFLERADLAMYEDKRLHRQGSQSPP